MTKEEVGRRLAPDAGLLHGQLDPTPEWADSRNAMVDWWRRSACILTCDHESPDLERGLPITTA